MDNVSIPPGSRAVLSLPIGSIAIPAERIGFFNADHAEGLGVDMAAYGQHDPIHVKRNGNAARLPWTLVAGLHRLRGAEHAQIATIDAIEVAGPKATMAELRRLELSENLDHRRPRPIERAIFTAARAQIKEEADHPGRVGERSQDRAVRARRSTSVTMTDVGWRERTAAAMECSVSTLERLQRIHRDIVEALPDLAQRLNFHPLGETLSAMRQVAEIKPLAARRMAVEAILSRNDWKSIEDALVAAKLKASRGFRVDPEKLGAVMMDAWGKMPLAGRRAHVEWLVENVTPGMAVEMVAGFRKRGLLP